MGKPCMGYRTRTDAAEALLRQGLTTYEIADRIEAETGATITPKMVEDLLSSRARQKAARTAPARFATYRSYLLACAEIDRKATLAFLRQLTREIEAQP